MSAAVAFALWVVLGTTGFVVAHFAYLLRRWREPVFRNPVLTLESDDWGAGPLAQAAALDRLAAMLARHRDPEGRSAALSLGAILGVADTGRQDFASTTLADPPLAPVNDAIRRGCDAGVFSPMLHGGEHYLPATLARAAGTDPVVQRWLSEGPLPATEALPSPLQSRWTDASVLPSRALDESAIAAAVAAETALYREAFRVPATVVVPPTFVWTPVVESHWGAAGVGWIVTPGRRFDGRDATGGVQAVAGEILAGERSETGMRYLVRNDYFEPASGHRARRAWDAIAAKTRLGRVTALEMHRANFLGDPAESALAELDRMLAGALRRFPTLRFAATRDVAGAIERQDPEWIETRFWPRVAVWLRRAGEQTRARKFAWLTGAVIPGGLLYAVARALTPEPSRPTPH